MPTALTWLPQVLGGGDVRAQTSSGCSQFSFANITALSLLRNRSLSQQNEKTSDTGGCSSLLHRHLDDAMVGVKLGFSLTDKPSTVHF